MRPNHLHCAARWLLVAGAAGLRWPARTAVVGVSGTGSQAGTTRSFNLFAEEGYVSMADGVQVYSWGYGAPGTTTNGTGRMQVSGPTLLVNQGETVTVNFTNRLPTRSSILFPARATWWAAADRLACWPPRSAPQRVGDLHLHRRAARHLPLPERHAEQPAGRDGHGRRADRLPGGQSARRGTGARTAYNHAGTGYDRETLFVVGDVDSDIHAAIDDQARSTAPPTTPAHGDQRRPRSACSTPISPSASRSTDAQRPHRAGRVLAQQRVRDCRTSPTTRCRACTPANACCCA